MDTQKPFWKPLTQNIRRHKPFVVLLGLVLLFLAVKWMVQTFQKPGHMGVIESQSVDMTVQPPEGAMPVETETVKSTPFSSAVIYTGSAVAFNDIPIFPRVEGWILALPVYPGDRVKKGQLLAQLDSRELTSQLNEAQFARESAAQSYYGSLESREQSRALAQKAEQAIQTAKANLAYWENEIKRASILVKEEVITLEEFQREQSQYKAAQSGYQQSLSERQAARKGQRASGFQANSLRAQTQQAAATARTQAIRQSYTRITAPMDGVILERTVPQGTLVTPGTQMLRMAQLSPLRIQAYIAQSDHARIQVGAPVLIHSAKFQNEPPLKAKVTAIFPVADLKSRTSIVEALIPNPDQRLLPGDYIQMTILTGKKEDKLTVANSALVDINQQQGVWVVQGEKVHLQYVTAGDTDGQRTEVTNGIHAGEVVVTRGNQNLREGIRVVTAQYGPDGIKTLPKPGTSTRLAEANGYKIKYPMDQYTVTVESLQKPPVVGDNSLELTVSGMPMASMPTMKTEVPIDLSLEMEAVMTTMPTMPVPKPTLQKLEKGRFNGTVNFSMPGLWQLTTTLKQGGKTIATQKFEVEVSE